MILCILLVSVNLAVMIPPKHHILSPQITAIFSSNIIGTCYRSFEKNWPLDLRAQLRCKLYGDSPQALGGIWDFL
jgi:hypothetical protein